MFLLIQTLATRILVLIFSILGLADSQIPDVIGSRVQNFQILRFRSSGDSGFPDFWISGFPDFHAGGRCRGVPTDGQADAQAGACAGEWRGVYLSEGFTLKICVSCVVLL